MKRLRSLSVLKNTLPWVVATLIFVQLFSRFPPDEMIQACRQANLLGLTCFMFGYFLLVLWLDCWGHGRVFTRFHAPISALELIPVRLASYVIMLLNYGAGQGTWAYFLKKKKNIPFFKAMGVLLFVIVLDLYLIITFAFVGSLLVPLHVTGIFVNHWVQVLMQVATAILVTAYFLRFTFLKIIPEHWEKLHDLFLTFREATIRDLLATLIFRLPLHLSFVIAIFLSVRFFHAHIPITSLLASIPLIYLIGSLPITPGGLGTTQAAFVILLQNHITAVSITAGTSTPEGLLLAMSILWACANYLFKALFGLFFFKRFLTPHSRETPPILS